MNAKYCPLCYTPLEVREVAPCWNCGHRPQEIEHALQGIHSYAEMRLLGSVKIVLCDFCRVDFGSYDPEFFGLPKKSKALEYGKMEYVRGIDDVFITQDKYCPQCNCRLSFLKFIEQARRINQSA